MLILEFENLLCALVERTAQLHILYFAVAKLRSKATTSRFTFNLIQEVIQT